MSKNNTAEQVIGEKYFLRVITEKRLVIYPETFERLIKGEMDIDWSKTNWLEQGQVIECKNKAAQLELVAKVDPHSGLPLLEIVVE